MIVKAPGKVILIGEHSVIYGKLAIAVGINLHAKASLSRTKSQTLAIELPDLKEKHRFNSEELERIFDAYKSRKSIDEYISGQTLPYSILPIATIAARLFKEFNVNPLGVKVKLTSKIPLQRGLGSSAALCTAFTVAMIKNSGINLSDDKIIEISRDGERIIHKNENAGRIDVSTSFYGGYTTFSSEKGTQRENVHTKLKLVIIDTGPKRSTSEMVGHVAQLHAGDKEQTDAILNEINEWSVKGLKAIKEGDLKTLGECMYEDHYLLEKLGVSTEGLNKAVNISKEHKAHGSKLSGGGGGGIAIAIVKNNKDALISKLKAQGFNVIETKISFAGAKSYL